MPWLPPAKIETLACRFLHWHPVYSRHCPSAFDGTGSASGHHATWSDALWSKLSRPWLTKMSLQLAGLKVVAGKLGIQSSICRRLQSQPYHYHGWKESLNDLLLHFRHMPFWKGISQANIAIRNSNPFPMKFCLQQSILLSMLHKLFWCLFIWYCIANDGQWWRSGNVGLASIALKQDTSDVCFHRIYRLLFSGSAGKFTWQQLCNLSLKSEANS